MENKHLPRDVFLYLLSIVALGMAAVNWGNLLFQFVNIYLPDVVADRYLSASAYYGSVRWCVATLVIVFPVLVWVLKFLNRDVVDNPEKRELRIRKWLLYFTLFIASVVVIGDLIALIYNFLDGGLTLQFLLKILVVLGIAVSILYYYLNELKEKAHTIRIFSWAIIVLVCASVIGGFLVAGSPNAQRLNKFDQQRIQDLQMIQSQVINYWQNAAKLPATLDELHTGLPGFIAPVDPKTRQPYEYQKLDATKFNLCATFQAENKDAASSMLYPVGPFPGGEISWIHDAGHQCFETDTTLYKSYQK